MVSALIGIYSLYILVRLYVSVMQIGYVQQIKCKGAVLMNEREYREAAEYTVAKERLVIAETFVEYVLFLAWMGGLISWIDTLFALESPVVHAIGAVVGMIVINTLFMLPFGWYSKFRIDQKFGFNRSSAAQYVKDTLISFVLTLVFGSLVVWGVFAIMMSSGMWWLWSFAFIMGVVIAINMFFPTIRALFFDKVTPLEDEALREKIEELMRKTGFQSSGVYISDASKRDARLNAYFGGLGKAKRVILFDTLIQKLTPEELIAVLGHELGHFAHGDLYKNIAVVGAMLFGMFAFFGNLPETLYLELGVAQSPQIVMILFILLLPAVSFFIMPLFGMMSRHNEFEADRSGAELGGAEYLVNALKKLVSENKSFPLSHPVYRFFHTTHPPVVERLRALGYDIRIDESEGYADPCPND